MTAELDLTAMREAKTAKEMLRALRATLSTGTDTTGSTEVFDMYAELTPETIENFVYKPLLSILEKPALDLKTRELVLIALLAFMEVRPGLVSHVQRAIKFGASVEEILEVIQFVLWEKSKCSLHGIGPGLEEGLKRARQQGLL